MIGSGESLNYIDLKLLKNEHTLGTGFLQLKEDIEELNLKYFIASEAGQRMDRFDPIENKNWPEKHLPTNGVKQGYVFLETAFNKFHANGTTIFLKHDFINYYKKIKLFDLNDKNIFYISTINGLSQKKLATLDLTKRFSSGGSIHCLIIISMYMGFKEIFLCGTGYTYNPTYELHFYDNYTFPKQYGKKEAEIIARKIVEAHNSQWDSNMEYYGLSEKEDVYRGIFIRRNQEKSNDMGLHKELNEFAKSRGVKIYNIVPEGFESPVYEKKLWKEVLVKL